MKSLRKIALMGHFGFGKESHNGQTVKTRVIFDELRRVLGDNEVLSVDTQGRWRFLLRLPLDVFRMLRSSRNIIIMPAFKGLCTISPILWIFNAFFHRKLHYIVIGGWLPRFLEHRWILKHILRRFDVLYVETASMKASLEQMSFDNVRIMPNCKPLTILEPEALPPLSSEPYPLCAFSRVSEDKGIGEAIEAVCRANARLGRDAFTLDIFGQIDDETWFATVMEGRPTYIRYGGVVDFASSVSVLKSHFALLFPTFYRGEGFAGTLIDAMAAGLPAIVSDWHANSELIEENVTGFLFPVHQVDSMVDILLFLEAHPDVVVPMKVKCLAKAHDYLPSKVVTIVLSEII